MGFQFNWEEPKILLLKTVYPKSNGVNDSLSLNFNKNTVMEHTYSNAYTIKNRDTSYTKFTVEIVSLINPNNVLMSASAQNVNFHTVFIKFHLILNVNLLQSSFHCAFFILCLQRLHDGDILTKNIIRIITYLNLTSLCCGICSLSLTAFHMRVK